MTIEIILTSVVISGLVSSLFLLLNEALRRRSDEKMTIFKTAAQLTELRQNQIIEVSKHSAMPKKWPAALNTFAKTYEEVELIWRGRYKKPNTPPLKTY